MEIESRSSTTGDLQEALPETAQSTPETLKGEEAAQGLNEVTLKKFVKVTEGRRGSEE